MSKYPDIGQIWEHIELYNYRIRVEYIEGNRIVVKCISSEVEGKEEGDLEETSREIILRYYRYVEELEGSRCKSCKDYNPYIKYDRDYKCWGCRNGY